MSNNYILETTFETYKKDLGKILSGIYCLTFLPTNQRYVGQSKEIAKRWTQYKRKDNRIRSQTKLWNVLEHSELKDWKLEVLEEVSDPADLLDIEDVWIEKLGTEKELNCPKGVRGYYTERLPLSALKEYLTKFMFKKIGTYYSIEGDKRFELDVERTMNITPYEDRLYTRNELKKIHDHYLSWHKDFILEKLIKELKLKETHKCNNPLTFFVDMSNFNAEGINKVGSLTYKNDYFSITYEFIKKPVSSYIIIAEKI